jgi:hypothetical protein
LAGLTGWGGGIDERPREEGFFASLFPHVFGRTEVTRELDQASPASLPNADRPRPVGTPGRWGRAEHREGRAAVYFCILSTSGFIFTKLLLCYYLGGGAVPIAVIA